MAQKIFNFSSQEQIYIMWVLLNSQTLSYFHSSNHGSLGKSIGSTIVTRLSSLGWQKRYDSEVVRTTEFVNLPRAIWAFLSSNPECPIFSAKGHFGCNFCSNQAGATPDFTCFISWSWLPIGSGIASACLEWILGPSYIRLAPDLISLFQRYMGYQQQ